MRGLSDYRKLVPFALEIRQSAAGRAPIRRLCNHTRLIIIFTGIRVAVLLRFCALGCRVGSEQFRVRKAQFFQNKVRVIVILRLPGATSWGPQFVSMIDSESQERMISMRMATDLDRRQRK